MRRAAAVAAALCAALLLAFPAAGAAKTPRDFFGVVSQGLSSLGSEDFDRMGRARVGHLRFLLYWPGVQPDRGPCEPGELSPLNSCDWSRIDPVVAELAARGIPPLPFVYGSPSWLDGNDGVPAEQADRVPPLRTKGDRRAWQDFLDAAVRRYGPGGTFWDLNPALAGPGEPLRFIQIWNEPSSPTYFRPKPSPRRYAKLVKLSDRAIGRSAEGRRVKVILAGLFGTPLGGQGGIAMPRFLRKLYRVKRIEKHFHAAAVHPYGPGLRGVKLQLRLARKEMKRGGDARSDLWVTEIGWASRGPKSSDLAKSPRGQAKLLGKAFRLLERRRRAWNIGGVSWFSWRDVDKDRSSCAACPWTGLLKKSGDPKPAYKRFRKFT